MFEMLLIELPRLIETYGYGLVALIIALESMGLPLPGEATLITASVYARSQHARPQDRAAREIAPPLSNV